jgi:mycothiol S-conjugate amidase
VLARHHRRHWQKDQGEEAAHGVEPTIVSVVPDLTLLTVHAHPDDEASKGAPTIAMYGARGVRTVLVCCTGGEEGDLQNPSLREPGQPFHGLEPEQEKALLAAVRPGELAQSAEIIGFDEVVMLGYRDSGMKDSPANEHPECFHQAALDEAVGRLVAVIRRERPQVILTYGDDQRGYPHPDHVRVHDISIPAFERAGDPTWYPEAGEPWQPSKLYYTVWAKQRLMAVHEALLRLRGSSPYDQAWLDRPGHDDRITTRLHIADYLWARSGALRAHATQVDPNEPWWFGLSDEELAEVYPYEDWILARSIVPLPPQGELEDDLFAAIPEAAGTAAAPR